MNKESFSPNEVEIKSLTIDNLVDGVPHDAGPWLESLAVEVFGIGADDG